MANKEIAVKTYVVKLGAGARERLEAMVRAGKSSARMPPQRAEVSKVASWATPANGLPIQPRAVKRQIPTASKLSLALTAKIEVLPRALHEQEPRNLIGAGVADFVHGAGRDKIQHVRPEAD